MIKNLFWRKEEVSSKIEFILNILFTGIPLIFALFYTNISTILAYVGAITGFALIYVFPVMVHLKRMRLKIESPLLAEAIDRNEFEVEQGPDKSPQIAIKDNFLERSNKRIEAEEEQMRHVKSKDQLMRRYYW